MAGEAITTLVGNITSDPELRYTQAGLPVANFTVAVNERKFDRDKNEWVEGDPMFMRCSLWRDQAEHLSTSLGKGTRVIVTGRLKQRSFENKEGANVTVIELEVDEIGPSLRYATAQITRAVSGSGRPAQTVPAGGWPNPGETDAWAATGDDTPF